MGAGHDDDAVPSGEPYLVLRLLARPRTVVRRHVPVRWRRLLAVFVGGVLGSGARVLVALLPHEPGGWPWATFLANVTGSLLLGYLLPRFQAAAVRTTLTVPLVCTGALGSYTTFSIFSVETLEMAAAGRPGLALAYVAGSVAVGYLLALVAFRVAERRP
jgi:fluoride exporter